ncbi:MAG: ATP-dependent DNA helicase RecG [Bacteroidetes bacterium]|nr:ATP-dependent DNA helicase RecG [Bacteroidota bacterium]
MSSLTYTTEIQFIPGIGPERAKALKASGIDVVKHLLHYYPRKYLDRTRILKIGNLRWAEGSVTVIGTVKKADLIKNRGKGGQRLQVFLEDGTGTLELIFFQGVQYLKTTFRPGEAFAVSGNLEQFGPRFSMIHPEYDHIQQDEDELKLINTGGIIPLYPTTDLLRKTGFDSRGFRRILKRVFERLDLNSIPDPLPLALRNRFSVSDLSLSLKAVHQPASNDELISGLNRLKLEEILYFSLQVALRKLQIRENEKGFTFSAEDNLVKKFYQALPFQLTSGQISVLRDIRQDLKRPHPMNRLIQGDVGSGKTVVAMMAMLMAVDNGFQAAFMAPTEILAEQHYKTMETYFKPLGLDVVLLTGSLKQGSKNTGLGLIQTGMSRLVVGTHALIEDQVIFQNLGLIVVDEQHRFGVMQRARLKQKGILPHVLVMSATPIPRTLAMTVYGDLEVSKIKELPTGRLPVKTTVIYDKDRLQLIRTIREQIKKGRQAYFVYPLIEESEKLDLKAATEAFEEIRSDFEGFTTGLLHGRMNSEEKEAVMSGFKSGSIQVLVSTTVIEVGVDVPNATVMVIEHAERFGLAQLHQLRGRVGRGHDQSYCFLITSFKLSKDGKERLATMEQTTDGFVIAEKDLEIRGAGDLYGTRQSGLPDLQLLDLVKDEKLVVQSREMASAILESDPHLRKPEHSLLRERLRNEPSDAILLNEIA